MIRLLSAGTEELAFDSAAAVPENDAVSATYAIPNSVSGSVGVSVSIRPTTNFSALSVAIQTANNDVAAEFSTLVTSTAVAGEVKIVCPTSSFLRIKFTSATGGSGVIIGLLLIGHGTSNLLVPTVYGSTTANGDLTLEGTSHSTKTSSYVILQPTDGNVGIGTTAPVVKLSVAGQIHAGLGLSPSNVLTDSAPTTAELPILTYYNGDAAGGMGTDVQGTTYLSSYFGVALRSQQGYLYLNTEGKVGVGVTPTAYLHVPACTAAANTASLKIPAGTVASTPVAGNIESDGTHIYWTDAGGTRRQLDN